MALLTVRNLSKKFGVDTVLDKAEFQLEEREIVSLVGPSQSGKTVLLKIIAGLEKPDEGAVLVDGQPVTEVIAREQKTVAIFQDYPPYRKEVANKKLPYFIMFQIWRRQVIKERIEVISDLMEIDHKVLLGARSHFHSRGQEQRLDLGRYLLAVKRLVLLDNPLLNLDIVWKRKLLDNLKVTLERLSLTTIYATHDKTEAQVITQKGFVLEKGRLVKYP